MNSNQIIKILLFSIIILLTTSPAVLRCQAVMDDAIMTNIELVQKRINSVSSSLNNLQGKIKKLSNNLSALNDEVASNNLILTTGLSDLNFELQKVTFDYYKMIHTIDSMRIIDKKMISKRLDSTNKVVADLIEKVKTLKSRIEGIDERLDKIPKIYFETDRVPSFNFELALNKFLTLNQKQYNVSPTYALGATLNISQNSSIWLNYSSPFILSVSYNVGNELEKISEHWNASIFSTGYGYTLKPKEFRYINIIGLLGMFYGNVHYDEYLNTTLNVDRSQTNEINTFGVIASVELSIHQYFYKNPIEFFFRANNHFSFKNIVLQTDLNNRFDFGAYLLSISMGVKFNMW